MKKQLITTLSYLFAVLAISTLLIACKNDQPAGIDKTQTKDSITSDIKNPIEKLYIDIHHIGAGKVTAEAVAEAHAKDLAEEKNHGVHFIKYWLDEAAGNVYCLASSADSQSIRESHAKAHGLIPDRIFQVAGGPEASANGTMGFFLDVHELGAGKVKAADVAAAHQKDLSVQKKHGVNFINYWFDEADGRVVCLSQAKDSASIISAHKEAHGLVPAYVAKVKQGGEK